MPCDTQILRQVPLFAALDDDGLALLADRISCRTFAPRQRIYGIDDEGGRAYVIISGTVRLTTVDQDHQDVIVDEPSAGELFGFASMLDGSPHQTHAVALEHSVCIEITRHDIATLVARMPEAAMGMLAVLGRHFHGAHQLVRGRAARNPNEIIEAEATLGERLADAVAGFGGSWAFIISVFVVLAVYTLGNYALHASAWDPYPFTLLNLMLSMIAALQAPIIMMSQNRQDAKDRLRGELDFQVNRRAELEVQSVSQKLNVVVNKVDDLEELVRSFHGEVGPASALRASARQADI